MDQSTADVVLVEDEGGVRILTLNRPTALNALNAAVFERLETALDEIEGDTGIRVVVIRGSGSRAFCAGADLDELAGLDSEAAAAILSRGERVFARIPRASPPFVRSALRGLGKGRRYERPWRSSRRDHHDLDLINRIGEVGFDRRSDRFVLWIDPTQPHPVHLGERPDIGEPDRRRQEF
jgi:Enoyl-CoA hydratase/isomerase